MRFLKDSSARLDYLFDWAALTNGNGITDWLSAGETITDHTITVTTGLTVDSSALTNTATSVIVWLSGGTTGNSYDVTCHITTSAGREDDRTIKIMCVAR